MYHDSVPNPSLTNFKDVATDVSEAENKHSVDSLSFALFWYCWAEGVLRLAVKHSLCEPLVLTEGIEFQVDHTDRLALLVYRRKCAWAV